jgi:trk system potassium uptake protein TrkA
MGRFGNRVAIALTERGFEVLAIDIHREKIEAIRDRVTHAVQIVSTTEDVFRSLGVDKVDVAIVGIGEHIEGSILTTALLKQMGVKKIIARAINELHGDILALVGADKVVYPEDEMGLKVAVSLSAPSLLDHIELSEGFGIAQLKCPPGLAKKTLKDIRLRTEYYVNVVAIKKTTKPAGTRGTPGGKQTLGTAHEEVMNLPHPDYQIEPDDILVIIGRDDDIERISKL